MAHSALINPVPLRCGLGKQLSQPKLLTLIFFGMLQSNCYGQFETTDPSNDCEVDGVKTETLSEAGVSSEPSQNQSQNQDESETVLLQHRSAQYPSTVVKEENVSVKMPEIACHSPVKQADAVQVYPNAQGLPIKPQKATASSSHRVYPSTHFSRWNGYVQFEKSFDFRKSAKKASWAPDQDQFGAVLRIYRGLIGQIDFQSFRSSFGVSTVSDPRASKKDELKKWFLNHSVQLGLGYRFDAKTGFLGTGIFAHVPIENIKNIQAYHAVGQVDWLTPGIRISFAAQTAAWGYFQPKYIEKWFQQVQCVTTLSWKTLFNLRKINPFFGLDPACYLDIQQTISGWRHCWVGLQSQLPIYGEACLKVKLITNLTQMGSMWKKPTVRVQLIHRRKAYHSVLYSQAQASLRPFLSIPNESLRLQGYVLGGKSAPQR